MKLPSQSQKRLHLCHQVQFALFYVGLFNPKQWEASPALRPPIRESRSLLLALTSMKSGCASGPAARCGRARTRAVGVASAPSASAVLSYSKLWARDQPERASLSVPARFPAHQMDAPLLESLEGSGVFCFNWRARADSYGAIFIREGLERGSVGTALQTRPWILNIIQLQLSDQLFFFSAGKVDEMLAR